MGGSASSITFKPNEASPSESSKKSVVSDPLDEVKFEDDLFWKFMGEFKREPVPIPAYAKLLGVHLAKHDITDMEDGSFQVKDVIGGYYGREVEVNYRHSYDPEANTWTQETDRDPNLAPVNVQFHYKIHSSPRVIELWAVTKESSSGGPAMAAMSAGLVGAILTEKGVDFGSPEEFYALFQADQQSLDGSGTEVALSPALDQFISFDQLLEGMEKFIRDGKGSPEMEAFEILEDFGPGVGFKTKEVVGGKENYAHHAIDKGSGIFKSTYYDAPGFKEDDKTHAFVTTVHKGPVRTETYNPTFAKRYAGQDVLKIAQGEVPAILEKAVQETAAAASA
eukprot:TRINITY_DN79449_c0_g1_i1.p1 TRINITY_DN79449_c0_g1~~TRINITY_DN79449_c0_g1_i1.p1  ORF type:complete len:337 (-),score=88.03 TRINITY_DN79449_c0_g1_i1:291-1301(-)